MSSMSCGSSSLNTNRSLTALLQPLLDSFVSLFPVRELQSTPGRCSGTRRLPLPGSMPRTLLYRRGKTVPNRLVSTTSSAYRLFRKSADALQSPFLLVIRLYWGWQLAQSGWGKLHHIPQVTEFFTSLNIPFSHANAVFVSNLEFFGGILLILGLA